MKPTTFLAVMAAAGAIVAATIAALVLGLLATRAAGDAQHTLAVRDAQGEQARVEIAQSELEVCTRVYSQLTLLEKVAAKQQTLAFYRRVLPDIPLRTIRRLLANAQEQTRIALAELNPAHCRDLPTQQLLRSP